MIEEIIVSCDGSGGSASIGDEESSQYSGLIAWGGVVGTLLLLLALRRLKRHFYAPPVTLIYNKRQPGNVIQTMLPMMKALKRGQYNHRC